MIRYADIQGNLHERPAGEPVEWRIGGYALVDRDGRLLLVETRLASRWRWDLPGGGIRLDPEESILDGTVREVYEETGYRFMPHAETLCLVDDAFFRTPGGRFWRMLTFAVQGSVGAHPDPDWSPPKEEIAAVAWIDPATLREGELLRPHWKLLGRLGYISEVEP